MENSPRLASEVQSWDDTADVVIVGYGAAGACAAIEAARAGADTLIVERASGGGGTSAHSGGLIYLGGGTPTQKALGFEDDAEAMFSYLMAACGPGPDDALIRPYAEHSVEHYHFLADCGLEFGTTFFEGAHEPPGDDGLTYSGSENCHPFNQIARPAPRGHCGKIVGSKGGLLMKALMDSAAASGARLRTGLLGQRLVTEADGRVCGVVMREAGVERCIRARRGVVLCAGGFIFNHEMLERYAPRLRECRMKVGTENDDGSGIRMGMAAGGAAVHMDAGDITLPLFPPVVLKQGLLVNAMGQRFLNEDAYFGRAGEFALLHQEGRVWLVVDEDCFERPLLTAAEVAGTGETIAELESELGMPEGALQSTVEYYNRYAGAGRDPLFHKRPEHVRALDRPPYGAFDLSSDAAVYCGFTLGGLHIDPSGRVLDPAGESVPGLFAAGRCASGVSKQGYSSGISLGDGTFFGRRAGRAAATAGD